VTAADAALCTVMHATAAQALLSAPSLDCATTPVAEDPPSDGYRPAQTQHASKRFRRRALPASSGLLADVLPALVGSFLVRGAEARIDRSFASTLSFADTGGAQLSALPRPTAPPLLSDRNGQLTLSLLSVAATAALMLLCGAVSVQLSLGLHKTIALATLRCVQTRCASSSPSSLPSWPHGCLQCPGTHPRLQAGTVRNGLRSRG